MLSSSRPQMRAVPNWCCSRHVFLPITGSGTDWAGRCEPCRWVSAEPVVPPRSALGAILGKWFMREMRHWGSDPKRSGSGPEAFGRHVDGMLDLAADVDKAGGIKRVADVGPIIGMIVGLSSTAARQRKAGQLDEADRTVDWYMILANRMLRLHPGYPTSYLVLSDAYSQRSKNAWKRKDLPAVKQCVDWSWSRTLQRAGVDPEDMDVRQLLQDRKERLRGVPGL